MGVPGALILPPFTGPALGLSLFPWGRREGEGNPGSSWQVQGN